MKASGILSILVFSEYRKEILFLLREGPMTLSELKDRFGIKSPEIIPRLKEMVASGLITKKCDTYSIAPFGSVLAKHYEPLLDTIAAIESNECFWLSHDVSSIPEELLFRIKELRKCNVVKAEAHNLFDSHKEFKENVSNALYFKGVTGVFIPSWIKQFSVLASQGVEIDIIITKEIYEKIRNEYTEQLVSFLQNGARIRVSDGPLKLAFSITDQFFSMSLHCKNGATYDHQNDLESNDLVAIKWGEDLFEYYKGKSVEIKLPANEDITQESDLLQLSI
jgi:predicted transcriptional regulator